MEKAYSTAKILIVDDEALNLDMLELHISNAGYETSRAINGTQALELLKNEHFDTILLDRVMPDMDGIEVLKQIKSDTKFSTLPVIIQTAKTANEDIQEGLDAGAYYYVTKPYDKNNLLSIIKTATNDHLKFQALKKEISKTTNTVSLLESGKFVFKTIEQGTALASLLSCPTPNPNETNLGLTELFVNAVEHGNLGISYSEKSTLLENGEYHEEITKRLSIPQFSSKKVCVEFSKNDTEISFIIRDEGEGFDWEQYINFSPERAFDAHGRGIATANSLSFSRLEYQDKGNVVVATVLLKKNGLSDFIR